MPTPGEHKTVQDRILGYAVAIGWTVVSREEAARRGGIAAMANGECEFLLRRPARRQGAGIQPALRRGVTDQPALTPRGMLFW